MTALQSILPVISALLSLLAVVFAWLAWSAARGAGQDGRVMDMLDRLPEGIRRDLGLVREDADRLASTQRLELQSALKGVGDSLDAKLGGLTQNLDLRLQAFAEIQQKTGENLAENQRLRLNETNAQVKLLTETLSAQQLEGRKAMHEELEKVRTTLSGNLEQLRKENEAKLEQMRITVDEKLQGTLNERLGESFKQVGDQLEAVHKGLGEMQVLASGVGDLKRVLTNVKSRGGWGEVQLGRVIEDAFTPDQYEKNFRADPRSGEQVEYAVRMPGQDEDCFIPIDSKFPNEAYERLLAAQDRAAPDEVERESLALERVVRAEALRICKYLKPPRTTDFAIMFLPTEGLYAEVIRRPGLFDDLQRKHRVTVVGPTTLSAFLSALQMGFRTLAIQQRSSEVWQVLAAAKASFQKYGEALDAVDKKLDEAKNKVRDVGVRNRDVERKLRGIEAYEPVALSGAAVPATLLIDEATAD